MLADDHAVLRGGLRLLLEAEPGLEVVAEAGDAAGARHCVRRHHPDVLVLDVNMPGGSVLELIPALRGEAPGTQIVMLTMQSDLPLVERTRRGGALGYVLKEQAAGDLVEAIRRAAAGEAYISRRLGSRLAAEQLRKSNWD